jgi:Uma2 family endonuclease
MMPQLRTSLPPLPIFQFSVDQYHHLATCGILGSDDPVELLEGLIVIKGCSTLAPAIQVRQWNNGHETSPLPVRRFTVEEYHRLIQEGILTAEDAVELVEGWLIHKMTRNPPHDVAVALILNRLARILDEHWHCRGQSAITTDTSEPEPDVAVVQGRERDYLSAHPRLRDIGMLVEVADATLETDRNLKGRHYARVAIPFYCMVNLVDGLLEVYSDPTGPDPDPKYRRHQDYGSGDTVSLILNGKELAQISVGELLP